MLTRQDLSQHQPFSGKSLYNANPILYSVSTTQCLTTRMLCWNLTWPRKTLVASAASTGALLTQTFQSQTLSQHEPHTVSRLQTPEPYDTIARPILLTWPQPTPMAPAYLDGGSLNTIFSAANSFVARTPYCTASPHPNALQQKGAPDTFDMTAPDAHGICYPDSNYLDKYALNNYTQWQTSLRQYASQQYLYLILHLGVFNLPPFWMRA